MPRARLLTNNVVSEGTLIIDSTGTVGTAATTWIKSETGGPTVNSSTAITYGGGATINFSSPAVGGGNAFATAAVNLDLSAARTISMALYASEYGLISNSALTLFFITSTPGTADLRQASMSCLKPGWNIITRPVSDFTPSGSPNWASIRQIRLRVDSSASIARGLCFGGLWFNKMNRPKVVISFDDGYSECVTIDAYCAPRNLRVSYGIIPSTIGTGGYLTEPQLAALAASSSSEICCHDVLNWAEGVFKPFGAGALLNRLNGIRNYISAYDPVGSNFAMYPEGDFGFTTQDLWKSFLPAFAAANFEATRTVAFGTLTSVPFIMDQTIGVGDINIVPPQINLNNATTLTQANQALDSAIQNGGNLIIYGHKIGAVADSLTWVTADFQAFMTNIARARDLGLVDVVSFSEWNRARAGRIISP